MKLPFCPHEEETAASLRENRWPCAADPALLIHARNCRRCSDIVLTAQTLQQARSVAVQSAHIGSPGYLWWRAQLRRRNRAVERVAEPIVWAEKFALISILCVACGFAFWQWGLVTDWLSWLAALFHSQAFQLDVLWLSSTSAGNLIGYSLLAGLGALVCIGALTLFMSAGKE